MIGSPNVDVMMREIYALDAAVAERKTAIKTDEVNVAEIFSKSEIAERAPDEAVSAVDTEVVELDRETELAMKTEPAIRQSTNDSAIRQSAIIERIRQSGNCRLKDIQDILPNISERTIRYDLQTLLEQNLIERIGNAGPSVFYRSVHAERPAEVETYVPEIR
jgi:predicted HTH transcriptional regulator